MQETAPTPRATRSSKKIALIASTLLLGYFALGAVAIGPLLKWGAEKFVTDKTGHSLQLESVKFDPLALELTLGKLQLNEPSGKLLLGFESLVVDLSASSLTSWAWTFDSIRLAKPHCQVSLAKNGATNWAPFLAAFKGQPSNPAQPLPRLLVRQFELSQGLFDFSDQSVQPAFQTSLTPLDVALTDLSTLPDDKGNYQLSARTALGAHLQWRGELQLSPTRLNGDFSLKGIQLQQLEPYLKGRVPMATPQGTANISSHYSLRIDPQIELNLKQISAHIADLRLRTLDTKLPTLQIKSLALLGGQLDLQEQSASVQSISLNNLALANQGKALLQIDSLLLDTIKANLPRRGVSAERLSLNGGKLAVVRSATGEIDWLKLFADISAQPASQTPTKPAAKTPASPAWSWQLARAELNDWQLKASDETTAPSTTLTLHHINASASELSQDLQAKVPVELSLQVQQGGSFTLQGQLIPASTDLDAQIKLSDLNLTPAQGYLGQKLHAKLASGLFNSAGQLRINEQPSFHGSFSINNLLVNEADSNTRVLAWKNVSSNELALTRQALSLGEVKADGLGLKLVIDKDKSINLQRLLKQPTAQDNAAAPPASPVSDQGVNTKPFKFAIDRIKLSATELDFSDQSLALPFATRIHRLRGTLDGIGSNLPAQLELDGSVDEYGLARAVGQISLLEPKNMTDIKVIFRNVEMNRLTPYSATFAGRQIQSGKLSLDLEYKINKGQLQGDNKIILNKLMLGERVESATATSLPLDLAIAILEDSDGIIDLELPISGSLEDPQFSYGGLVWKAIVNVIGKIVLAPFRALGSLLGAGSEKFEHITFEVGEARLLPPERDKLKQLAQTLAKRPNLALTASATWNPVSDRLALQENQIRRDIATQLGRKLAADEEPGPVSTAQPKTQEALEKLYSTRLGADTLQNLKEKFAQANPQPAPSGTAGKLLSRLSGLMKSKPAPLSEQESVQLKGADLHVLMYQGLLEKILISEEQLKTLAQERGQAIQKVLQRAGIGPERVSLQASTAISGEGREVPTKLGLTGLR